MKISECTLSKETRNLLYRYFAAAANLYGVIEIGKLLNLQQPERACERGRFSVIC
uniref:hypothetical protein n=1 Tax=Ruminococcus bromii TaxID=40518 RepID=UPI0040273B2D